MNLEYPLNVDIRVSDKCSFGQRPDGTYVLCNYCHEEAKTDGSECDYDLLKLKLADVPAGIELAIGSNNLTLDLMDFLAWAKVQGYFCNLTINQGHLKRDIFKLLECIEKDLIKGLGISYRKDLNWNIPVELLEYQNTVFHVIMGIDSVKDVVSLRGKGVKKVLVLGEKDFGFNEGKVDTNSLIHKQWVWQITKLFDSFNVVSFDNLAIEQLDLKRLISKDMWDTFYQGEESFYINAVKGSFAPNSRSKDSVSWNDYTIKSYYKTVKECQ